MEFADLVRNTRTAKFKSARQFFTQCKLPCTYFYYGSVERGIAVPSVDLAIAILKALKIDQRQGLLAWARSQMPDAETKSVFADLSANDGDKPDSMPASDTLVINRGQATFLTENPLAMEILTYITCRDESEPVSKTELAQQFKLPRPRIDKLLKQLYEQSLIEKDDQDRYFAQEWVLVPFIKDFEPVNDAIFSRAYQQFHRANPQDRLRHVVTVRLVQSQRQELEGRLRALVNWAAKEATSDSKDAIPYTFGAFASPRIFGDAD